MSVVHGLSHEKTSRELLENIIIIMTRNSNMRKTIKSGADARVTLLKRHGRKTLSLRPMVVSGLMMKETRDGINCWRHSLAVAGINVVVGSEFTVRSYIG